MKKVLLAGLVLLAVAVLAGLFMWLRPPPPATQVSSQPVLVQPPLVRIEQGQRVAGPALIRIPQGATVLLHFASDRDGELHLHGYDKHVQLLAGKVVTLKFKAEHSGRFEYELHGHSAGHSHGAAGQDAQPLGMLVVAPH